NSGQRCTAIKRILVQELVAERFVELLLEKTRAVKYGDPMDPSTDMGTVIDEAAARTFEQRVNDAVAQGARLLYGNTRAGALYSPAPLDRVQPEMLLVKQEPFDPASPVMTSPTLDEPIRIATSPAYGLSPAVCTNRLDYITRFVAELNVGSV